MNAWMLIFGIFLMGTPSYSQESFTAGWNVPWKQGAPEGWYLELHSYNLYRKVKGHWLTQGPFEGSSTESHMISTVDPSKNQMAGFYFCAGLPKSYKALGKKGDFYLDSKTGELYQRDLEHWFPLGYRPQKSSLAELNKSRPLASLECTKKAQLPIAAPSAEKKDVTTRSAD